MAKHNNLGKSGEAAVAIYLEKNGYTIRHRNWREEHLELDIVASKGDCLVVVEVKTRKEGSLVSPAEAVDTQKQRKLASTAAYYMMKSFCELQPRFDVAEITVVSGKKGEEYEIKYIENAFAPEAF